MLSNVNVVLLQDLPLKMKIKLIWFLSGFTDLLVFEVKLRSQSLVKLSCSFFLDVELNKEIALHHVADFGPIFVINV
jgi:hypothetical protein